MGKKLQGLPPLAVVLSIVLTILLSACGGSSSSESSSSSPSGNAEPTKGNGNPLALEESGGGASSFIEPNNPNSKYAKFGQEASSAERSAASEILAENLEARESADFETQCETLSLKANEEITEVNKPAEARSRCAEALKQLATPLSGTKSIRANNFAGQLAVFRVKGGTGYALYHGNDGKDWVMPMAKEGSGWKAASIIITEAP